MLKLNMTSALIMTAIHTLALKRILMHNRLNACHMTVNNLTALNGILLDDLQHLQRRGTRKVATDLLRAKVLGITPLLTLQQIRRYSHWHSSRKGELHV